MTQDMLRGDGSRLQSGLGPPQQQSPPLFQHKFRYMKGTILNVYQPGDEGNPLDVPCADVLLADAKGCWPRTPIMNANPGERYSVQRGDRCMVWFLDGAGSSAFIFGFAPSSNDNVATGIGNESIRTYQDGSILGRVNGDGATSYYKKNLTTWTGGVPGDQTGDADASSAP